MQCKNIAKKEKFSLVMASGDSRHQRQLKSYLAAHKSPAKKNRTINSAPEGGRTRENPASKCQSASSSKVRDLEQKLKTTHVRQSSTQPQKSKNVQATAHDLPDEVLLHVLSFLDGNSLLMSGMVCKRWWRLANDKGLWQELYLKYTKKLKDGRLMTDKVGEQSTKSWKQMCIQRSTELRNHKVLALLKSIHKFTGLPAKTEKALELTHTRWQLTFTDTNGKEHNFLQRDKFSFAMSQTCRWHSLEFPPVKNIKHLQLYALNPVFLSGQSGTNSYPCKRSLLLGMRFEWSKLSSTLPVIGQDDFVTAHVVAPGLLIATWKDGGELAFVSVSMHHHLIVEKCLLGTWTSCYNVPPHKPVKDDIDSQYGLHGYTCTLELRNQRVNLWSQQFQQLHCKPEQIVDGHAVLHLIRPDHRSDHIPISKKLSLPWKTELFKGIIQNLCILDMTLLDERRTPMWCQSNPVQVTKPETNYVNYDYDGDYYHIDCVDEGGKLHMELIWVEERDQFIIVCLEVHIGIHLINEWFDTKY